jgi:hypothetical protein
MIKEISGDRLVDPSCAFTQAIDDVAINWLILGGISI